MTCYAFPVAGVENVLHLIFISDFMISSDFRTAIFPARYFQGPGAIKTLPGWISQLGSGAFIVAGQKSADSILSEFIPHAPVAIQVERFRGECTRTEINRLTLLAGDAGFDVVVALGGGKVIDTGKAVALELNSKIIIVPTVASNDAPCSAISVVYNEEGIFEEVIHLKRNPDLVLLDSEIIAHSPVRLLVAGMGDALSTWFEADSCFRSGSPNEAGGFSTRSARMMARLCYDTLLEFGVDAVISCREKRVTPALEHIIETNTLMSGIGFESAGLGSAHAIHNGLTCLRGTHAFFHGEKVAFGVLAGLFLTDRPESLIREVYSFCVSVGLPVTLSGIGVIDPSDEDLKKVAEAACAPEESIWHEPVTINVDRVIEALIKADEWGRK